MDKSGEAFENLVGLDNHNNPFNRQLPPEGRCEGKGHNYKPCAYKVHFHGELSVSAALENAEANGHLIAHAHHNNAHYGNEIGGHNGGLIVKLIKGEQGIAEHNKGDAKNYSYGKVKAGKGAGVGFDSCHISSAYGCANHNGGGGGHGNNYDLQILIESGGHRVCSNCIIGKMAQYCGLHGNGNTPENSGAHNGEVYLAVIAAELGAAFEKFFGKQLELIIAENQIIDYNYKLGNSGNQCSYGCAFDTHLGHTKLAKNKNIVYADIDDKRDERNIKGYFNGLNSSQSCHQGLGNYKQQKCPGNQ